MSAFNARLKPKEVFGFPLSAVLSCLVALVTLFMALVPQVPLLNLVSGVLAAVAMFLAILFLVMGDEVAFLRIRLLAIRESKLRDPLDIE